MADADVAVALATVVAAVATVVAAVATVVVEAVVAVAVEIVVASSSATGKAVTADLPVTTIRWVRLPRVGALRLTARTARKAVIAGEEGEDQLVTVRKLSRMEATVATTAIVDVKPSSGALTAASTPAVRASVRDVAAQVVAKVVDQAVQDLRMVVVATAVVSVTEVVVVMAVVRAVVAVVVAAAVRADAVVVVMAVATRAVLTRAAVCKIASELRYELWMIRDKSTC